MLSDFCQHSNFLKALSVQGSVIKKYNIEYTFNKKLFSVLFAPQTVSKDIINCKSVWIKTSAK